MPTYQCVKIAEFWHLTQEQMNPPPILRVGSYTSCARWGEFKVGYEKRIPTCPECMRHVADWEKRCAARAPAVVVKAEVVVTVSDKPAIVLPMEKKMPEKKPETVAKPESQNFLWVWCCTFDPAHTIDRVKRVEQAISDGTVAKLLKLHGKDGINAELMRLKMLSSLKKGTDVVCAECQMPMERLAGPEGVSSKLEATRAVTSDFGKYIERTRCLLRGMNEGNDE